MCMPYFALHKINENGFTLWLVKNLFRLLDSQSETNLRSRRLEVKGARKNGVCEGDTQRERDRCFYLLSESAKNSSWLIGFRGDKCLP